MSLLKTQGFPQLGPAVKADSLSVTIATDEAPLGAVVTVADSTGANQISPDSMPQTLTYNGDGTIATISVTNGTDTWVQTLTYTAGNLTGVSAWVKQ